MTYEGQKIGEREVVKTELDREVIDSAEFLTFMDQVSSKVTLDETTGKITFQSPELTLSAKHRDNADRYLKLIQEYKPKNQAFLERVKDVPGVRDATIINGAVVVVCDSSQGKIDLPMVPTIDGQTERGRHIGARDSFLGLVIVDMNPVKRSDGVSSQTTLIHELHHFNLSLSDYFFGSKQNVQMMTGVRENANSALFGRDQKNPPTSGFLKKESYKRDARQYEALTGQDFSEFEIDNLELQQLYLDELHSSFLQRKPSWFSAAAKVYSGLRSGTHDQIVGTNPEAITSVRELLANLQAIYIFDQNPMPQVYKLAMQRKSGDMQLPAYLEDLAKEWPQFFDRVGGLIGMARTVNQAQRLVKAEWIQFKTKYHEFFTKNKPAFDGTVAQWQATTVAAPTLASYFN